MPADVVTCIAFRRDVPDIRHDLVRAFRAGEPEAAGLVLAEVRLAVGPHAARLFGPGTLAVAVPGHRAGSTNEACESLIRALAAEHPELVPGPGVLVRVRDSPEAKSVDLRDPVAEAATLRWEDARVPGGVRRVLLVDDVLRSGATLDAARAVLPAWLQGTAVALAIFRATAG